MLAQLGNKIQHGLHAYTPADQRAVKAAADSFRVNPAFDTYETLLALGTGEAVVSFLQEDGTPGIAEKVAVLPPQSRMGAITETERDQSVRGSLLYSKYANAYDPDSAYEFLARRGVELAAAAEEEKKRLEEEKLLEKERREQEKLQESEERKRRRAMKSTGSTVAGTIGREIGKVAGGAVGGRFGKTLGGNLGASLFRGVLGTLFKD